MDQALILWPLVAQVILVILLFIRLGQLKDRARAAGVVDFELTALDNDAWPDDVRQVANNIRNQFQVPVLFFVLVLALHVRGARSDIYALVFAWIFVATRVMHSLHPRRLELRPQAHPRVQAQPGLRRRHTCRATHPRARRLAPRSHPAPRASGSAIGVSVGPCRFR